MMLTIGGPNSLVFYAEGIEPLVECPHVLRPGCRAAWIGGGQQKFGRAVVVVSTKQRAAPADSILRARGKLANTVATVLPGCKPAIGISRSYVLDCLQYLRRICSAIGNVVQRAQ